MKKDSLENAQNRIRSPAPRRRCASGYYTVTYIIPAMIKIDSVKYYQRLKFNAFKLSSRISSTTAFFNETYF